MPTRCAYLLLLAYSILKSPLPEPAAESAPFSPSPSAGAAADLFLSKNFLILGWSAGLQFLILKIN
jgi:hypothetical protein